MMDGGSRCGGKWGKWWQEWVLGGRLVRECGCGRVVGR